MPLTMTAKREAEVREWASAVKSEPLAYPKAQHLLNDVLTELNATRKALQYAEAEVGMSHECEKRERTAHASTRERTEELRIAWDVTKKQLTASLAIALKLEEALSWIAQTDNEYGYIPTSVLREKVVSTLAQARAQLALPEASSEVDREQGESVSGVDQ